MLCDTPVDAVNAAIFTIYASSAHRHQAMIPATLAVPATNRQITRYMQ